MTPDELYDAFRRAELFLDADQPTEAAAMLEPVRAAHPDDTSVLELQARALFFSAQLSRAEAALRELVERRPDDAWARTALARALERQSRHDEARAVQRVADALSG